MYVQSLKADHEFSMSLFEAQLKNKHSEEMDQQIEELTATFEAKMEGKFYFFKHSEGEKQMLILSFLFYFIKRYTCVAFVIEGTLCRTQIFL